MSGETAPTRPIRLVSVIHSASFGGPHNQAIALHRHAEALDLTVVLPDDRGDAVDRLRDAGLHVETVSLIRPRRSTLLRPVTFIRRYLAQILTMRDLFQSVNAEVVETHGLLNFDGAIAAKLARASVVWQIIDTRPAPALRRSLGPIIRSVASIVMVSGHRVAALHGIGRSQRVVVFYPPVERLAGSPATLRMRARAELDIDAGAVAVGMIANFNPQKAHAKLIDAVYHLQADSCPAFQSHLVGSTMDGHEEYFDSVLRRARMPGIRDVHVHADGRWKGNLLVHAFDVLAITSTANSEGVPTVALEAMAAGVPVLAFDSGAIREILADGVSGRLISQGDQDGFEAALHSLVSDSDLRSSLGAGALIRYTERFGTDKFIESSCQAYAAAAADIR